MTAATRAVVIYAIIGSLAFVAGIAAYQGIVRWVG